MFAKKSLLHALPGNNDLKTKETYELNLFFTNSLAQTLVAGPQHWILPNLWLLAPLTAQVTQNLIDCKIPYLLIQRYLFVPTRSLQPANVIANEVRLQTTVLMLNKRTYILLIRAVVQLNHTSF